MTQYEDANKLIAGPTDFVYFCITSDNHDEMFLERDSLFNRFNTNIIEHTSSRFFISQLPKSLKELTTPWPFCSKINDDYNMVYTRESFLIDPQYLSKFGRFNFGAFFVPDYISQEVIDNLRRVSKLPVFSTIHNPIKKRIMPLNDYAINEFYKKNISNINKMSTKGNFNLENVLNQKFDKRTGLSPINVPDISILEPLKILINRLRGIYQNNYDVKFKVLPIKNEEDIQKRQKDILFWNEFYLKQIILEKIIISKSTTQNGVDELIKHLPNIEQLDNKTDLTPDELVSNYDYFLEAFNLDFDNIHFLTDMVFYLPILNKHSFDVIYKALLKKNISKRILNQIYEGGYGFGHMPANSFTTEKRMNDFNFYLKTMFEKQQDNRVVDSLFINYALSKKIPFLRLPFLPAKILYQKSNEIYQHATRVEELLEITKFNDLKEQIESIVENTVSKQILKIIASKGKHIKFISDFPIEWIDNNGLPLYVEKSVSRLPVMPGNGLIEHSYNSSFELGIQNTKILIINSLSKLDESSKILYRYGTEFKSILKREYFGDIKKVCYFEPENKNDFVQKIESFKPTILIYYGHGSHNLREDEGYLNINGEKFAATEVEKLSWVPPIVILGACETQTPNTDYLNIGNCFFLAGSTSVLATYFPVDGLFALTFLESLFRNLLNVMRGNDLSGVKVPEYLKTWADIILQTRRSEYMFEPCRTIIQHLKGKKKKTPEEKEILKILTKSDETLMKFVMTYCFSRVKTNLTEAYTFRNDAYKEFLKNNPEALNVLNKYLDHKYIFPESLIFTSLGSPEKIIISKQ